MLLYDINISFCKILFDISFSSKAFFIWFNSFEIFNINFDFISLNVSINSFDIDIQSNTDDEFFNFDINSFVFIFDKSLDILFLILSISVSSIFIWNYYKIKLNLIKNVLNSDSKYKNIPSYKMFYNNKAEKNHLKHKINKILKSKIFENNKLNDNANNKSNDNSKDNKIKPETKNINLFKTNIKINNSKNKYTNKKNIFFSLPQITFKNINNSKEEKDKHKKFNTLEAKNNNKISLSEFNKYEYNRKNIEDDYQTNNKISNIHHYNNNIINNNFVNFRKMSSRNYKFLINSYSLDIPSSDKYNPKYSYIEDNVKNIKFTPFGLNKNNKKFLLKKMMNSYNVPTEYQFIDNEKLSNDNELINRQLILNHNIYPLK